MKKKKRERKKKTLKLIMINQVIKSACTLTDFKLKKKKINRILCK